MRLQLAIFAVAATRVASADPDVAASARVSVYADSDHTNITTSALAASGNVADGVRVDAQYLVDAVSSASVDVITAATGRIHDVRSELTAGATLGNADRSLHASYIYSREHDWFSHTVGLGGSSDFLHHNLTVGLSGSLGFNQIHRMGDAELSRRLTTFAMEAFAAYTVSPRDLVMLGTSVAFLDGFQASPYRFVVYDDLRAVYEIEPETRLRETATLRWHHHLFADSALRTMVRGYRDSWDLLALTAQVDYVVGLGALDVGFHVRGYHQTDANFYRPSYGAMQPYMTSDRELGRLSDVFAGTALVYLTELAERKLRIELDADAFEFRFDDVPRLRSRHGVVAGIGVGLAL